MTGDAGGYPGVSPAPPAPPAIRAGVTGVAATKFRGSYIPLQGEDHGPHGGGMGKQPETGDSTDLIQQLTDKVEGLEEALLSRDVIGQAKGILMERLHLTPDQAFEELRAASQKHNRKVRDIAAELADTGEWPAVSTNGDRPQQ